MRVIILAAGQGKRMLPLTKDVPKALLPVGKRALLSRLVEQIIACGAGDITIVVGFRKEQVIKEIEKFRNPSITIVENNRYEEDTNILSLTLALSRNVTPFILFEADLIFDDDSVRKILDISDGAKSFWYTVGLFQSDQAGGILKSGRDGIVTDVKVVDKYDDKYEGYKKLIGILTVGRNEIDYYSRVLFDECQKSIKQYYLTPWINNLARLRCYECDLPDSKAVAFNTPEEYREALELFGKEHQ